MCYIHRYSSEKGLYIIKRNIAPFNNYFLPVCEVLALMKAILYKDSKTQRIRQEAMRLYR